MKKVLSLAAAAMMFSSVAQAGEYAPYVGFDYVNMTPNVSDKYPDNYNLGSLTAGIKFVNIGSLEMFAERSMREKTAVNSNIARGRIYGYGADLLLNGYNFSQGAILASVGYGRMATRLKYNSKVKKADGNALRFGLGTEVNPTPEWGLRAMFRYSLSDNDNYKNAKEFTLGVRYYFY